jgi:hypothetical protein
MSSKQADRDRKQAAAEALRNYRKTTPPDNPGAGLLSGASQGRPVRTRTEELRARLRRDDDGPDPKPGIGGLDYLLTNEPNHRLQAHRC